MEKFRRFWINLYPNLSNQREGIYAQIVCYEIAFNHKKRTGETGCEK